ncbi:MAG: hypothetical protein WKF34_02130 [Pyrinomonadaceae bacterium]
MRIPAAIFIILSLLAMSRPPAALGFETDQYNLPPVPLADIGDEVSDHVEKSLFAVLASLNGEIAVRSKCLKTSTLGCRGAEVERRKLAYLRSESTVAEMLYARLGKGSIFRSGFGRWMETHKFRTQPDRYKAPYSETIFVLKPSNYATLSPTVRMYDSEFGIDKLDHFFQQGHEYYELKRKALTAGATVTDAEKAAIAYGQKTERTYFGLLVSGVYSNADLYANYVGMKFYENLTKPIDINNRIHPALASLRDGQWELNTAALLARPLKSYISDHLNEAWNPSSFRLTLVRSVRREVKKHACPKWRVTYPTMTGAEIAKRSGVLRLWHDDDYGHTSRDRTVTVAETCFENPPSE